MAANTVSCTAPGCYLKFKSLAAMQRHKAHDSDHEYCQFCDLDFESFEEHLDHQIEVGDSNPDDLNHMKHPARQNLDCHACGRAFENATGFIKHIEEEECHIRQYALIGQIQHKELVKAILEDPAAVSDMLNSSWVEAAHDSDDAGGVSLLDDDFPTTEAQTLVPLAVDGRGGPPLEQQVWPSLADGVMVSKGHKSQKSATDLSSALGAMKIEEEEKHPCESVNILEHQFWNPMSDKYSPEYFRQPIEDHYVCPFPLCRFRFPIAADITTHLKTAHRSVKSECPSCYKRYDRVWKIFNHLELGTERCKVQQDDKYLQYVDKFSGGLVTAAEQFRRDGRRPLKYIKYTVEKDVSLKLYNPKRTVTVGRRHEAENLILR